MGIDIEISLRSQELIRKYQTECHPFSGEIPLVSRTLDLTALLGWLDSKRIVPPVKSTKSAKELEFTLMSLRTELLHDLYLSLPGNEPAENKIKNDSSSLGKLKFILLALAGVLVAACEGFDSVVTMMSIFSLPASVILASAFIFSFLSAVAFCGLELVQLSRSIGVKLTDVNKALDVYLRQLEEIKLLRKKISKYNLAELSTDELRKLELIAASLQQRFAQLSEAGAQFEQALNNKGAQVARLVLSGITSTLFFGGAFCSGQTVSMFLLGLFMSSVSPAAAPVLLFSLIVGLAAVALFWGVEFPSFKSWLSGWFGLDEERVAILCDKELLTKEEKKITSLQEKIAGTLHLKEKLSALGQSEPSPKEKSIDTIPASSTPSSTIKLSDNIFSFMHPKPKSSEPPISDEPTLTGVNWALQSL